MSAPSDPAGLITIATPELTARINVFGAELSTLTLAEGGELLWDGDPAFWTGRAPLLFPIVGALEHGRYRLGEATFSMAQHGFARRRLFALVAQSATSLTLRLEADAETLAQYPFHFRLDATFTVEGCSLTMAAQIANLGGEPMPASFGFHPALRWPLPGALARAGHQVRFTHDEPAPVRRLTSAGTLSLEAMPTPVRGDVLDLTDALFENDALIFDQVVSRQVSYGAPESAQLEIAYEGMPYLGIWTKPGAGYICIEPWHGIADPAGYDGDFCDKPGVFRLSPGCDRSFEMKITAKAR
jgi:galactose mutarotase-like enzyme